MTPARTKQMLQSNKVVNVDGGKKILRTAPLIPPKGIGNPISDANINAKGMQSHPGNPIETASYYLYVLSPTGNPTTYTYTLAIISKTTGEISRVLIGEHSAQVEVNILGEIPGAPNVILLCYGGLLRRIRVYGQRISLLKEYNLQLTKVSYWSLTANYYAVCGYNSSRPYVAFGTYNNATPVSQQISTTQIQARPYILGNYVVFPIVTSNNLILQWINLTTYGSGEQIVLTGDFSNKGSWCYDEYSEFLISFVYSTRKAIIIKNHTSAMLVDIPGGLLANVATIYPHYKKIILTSNAYCSYSSSGLSNLVIMNTTRSIHISGFVGNYIISGYDVFTNTGSIYGHIDISANPTLLVGTSNRIIEPIICTGRYSENITAIWNINASGSHGYSLFAFPYSLATEKMVIA